MENVYVTGVKGMLGRAILPIFGERYKVFPANLEEPDICDTELISREICDCDPRFVIHLAAMTDVDGCQTDPDQAYRINTLGTRNVALACQRCDAAMVYISTGMVYDGTKENPYTEYDRPAPVNIYGDSKYQGELIISDLLPKYFIFSSCWLFGGGMEDKKFVAKIFERAGKSSELKIVDDTFGSPTYTTDLARAILAFIETGLYGRYHCVNGGCVNRFEVAEEILRIAGFTGCELKRVSSADFPLTAPRPRMEALRNYNFELLGLDLMRDWRSALEEYIRTALL